MAMRLLIAAIGTILLAGCASVPAAPTAVYDQKTNLARTVAKAPANEFVGTSASAKRSATATPSWYAFGHP
jgi:hypothetical protein